MFEDLFQYKRVNLEKLEPFGFIKNEDIYRYEIDILDCEFHLVVTIDTNLKLDTTLIEKTTQEEYILYKTHASGEYVGKIRDAVKSVLQDILDQCYYQSLFMSEQAQNIIEYVRKTYGDELEFLWDKYPRNAIFRHQENKKWYGAMLSVSKRKLGISSDEIVEILDLRNSFEKVEKIVDHKKYYPGWHMNKKYWYTIILDGSISLKDIYRCIDESYQMTK